MIRTESVIFAYSESESSQCFCFSSQQESCSLQPKLVCCPECKIANNFTDQLQYQPNTWNGYWRKLSCQLKLYTPKWPTMGRQMLLNYSM